MAKTILEAALEYHDAGFCVIPLRRDSKAPAGIKWEPYQKKRPTREQVEKWFSKEVNIGIICGEISGNLQVIDFDKPAEYEKVKDQLPKTWIVKTGREEGGYHTYFRSLTPEKSHVLEGRGIEIRAEGNYVVAPPSIHPDTGGVYKFISHPPKLAATPDLTALKLVPEVKTASAQTVEPNWVTKAMAGPVGEGSRDTTCTRLAGHFLRLLPRDEVELILINWGQSRCDPPFEFPDVMKCINSIDQKRGGTQGDLVALTLNEIVAQDLPEVPELVNNWLRVGDTTLLVGGGGVGKSSIALPCAMSLAAGEPFLGFGVEKPAKVLYLDLEMGPYEFKVRAGTLAQSFGELVMTNFYGASLSTFRINKEGNLARLRRLIEKVEPQLLVIDNHSRFHTGDPNSERDMQDMIVDPTKGIMDDYHLAILYLMHTPWKEQNRPRGSMTIFDMGSTMISIEKGGSNERNRILRWTKNRPAKREERIDTLTALYDPTTFTVERAEDSGISDDVLQGVSWPIKPSHLAKVLKEHGYSQTGAYDKIRKMKASGDLVEEDGLLNRPGGLPKTESLVPIDGEEN